jgi:Glycosyl transferase family 90
LLVAFDRNVFQLFYHLTFALNIFPLQFSTPAPSYMSIIDAQKSTSDWYTVFSRFSLDYPWASKQRKVVWRGALSENDPKRVFTSQRWRLCKFVNELTDPAQKEMFDVGLTTIPEFLTAQIDIDEKIVGGVVKGLGAMNDFQKFTAIMDMDGNSWSSRFRTMLCYNSVAIKVEPAYVDYFFSDLVPWKHYIPIKDDLSDLLENVAFALDPANDAVVQEIIASANQWCSERSTHKGLVYDMLDSWESYVQLLDRADPNWPQKWDQKKNELFSPSSNIPLVQLKQHA